MRLTIVLYWIHFHKATICTSLLLEEEEFAAGYGGSYFSPPWLWLLALQIDNAGMREPGNSLAQDQVAWVQLYRQTLQIVNQKLEEKGLDLIKSIGS